MRNFWLFCGGLPWYDFKSIFQSQSQLDPLMIWLYMNMKYFSIYNSHISFYPFSTTPCIIFFWIKLTNSKIDLSAKISRIKLASFQCVLFNNMLSIISLGIMITANGQVTFFSPFKVYLLLYVTSLLWNIEVIYEWLFYVTVLGLKCILLNKGV